MKHLFFAIILLNLTFSAGAQFWAPVGSGFNFSVRKLFVDSNTNILYAGGNFWFAGDTPVEYIAKWNGNEWASLPSFSGSDAILSMATYNNQLYVGGFAQTNSAHLKRLNGNQWESVGGGTNGTVKDMEVYNNDLYVAGFFDTVGTIQAHGIAKWDGLNWNSLNFPNYELGGNWVSISCIMMYNDELYVGGRFRDATGEMVNIAKYDGVSWLTVEGGLKGQFAAIWDMEIYQGELYVGGRFSIFENNPENGVVRWNGNQWHNTSGGVYVPGYLTGTAYDLHVFNEKLIVGGAFSYAGNVPAYCLASWDGQEWCAFTNDSLNGVNTIVSFNNELYIGGGFDTIAGDTLNYIAKWTGGNYTDTCGAIISVEENQFQTFQLEIHPNPATNLLTIKTTAVGKAEYYIYDINGKLLQSQSFLQNKTIDISTFAEAIYLLQVQTNKGTTNRKFVISK